VNACPGGPKRSYQSSFRSILAGNTSSSRSTFASPSNPIVRQVEMLFGGLGHDIGIVDSVAFEVATFIKIR